MVRFVEDEAAHDLLDLFQKLCDPSEWTPPIKKKKEKRGKKQTPQSYSR